MFSITTLHQRFDGRLSIIDWKTSSKYARPQGTSPLRHTPLQAQDHAHGVLRLRRAAGRIPHRRHGRPGPVQPRVCACFHTNSLSLNNTELPSHPFSYPCPRASEAATLGGVIVVLYPDGSPGVLPPPHHTYPRGKPLAASAVVLSEKDIKECTTKWLARLRQFKTLTKTPRAPKTVTSPFAA